MDTSESLPYSWSTDSLPTCDCLTMGSTHLPGGLCSGALVPIAAPTPTWARLGDPSLTFSAEPALNHWALGNNSVMDSFWPLDATQDGYGGSVWEDANIVPSCPDISVRSPEFDARLEGKTLGQELGGCTSDNVFEDATFFQHYDAVDAPWTLGQPQMPPLSSPQDDPDLNDRISISCPSTPGSTILSPSSDRKLLKDDSAAEMEDTSTGCATNAGRPHLSSSESEKLYVDDDCSSDLPDDTSGTIERQLEASGTHPSHLTTLPEARVKPGTDHPYRPILQDALRRHFLHLLGIACPSALPMVRLPTDQQVRAFESKAPGAMTITAERWVYHFAKPRNAPFNLAATRIFVEDFMRRVTVTGWYCKPYPPPPEVLHYDYVVQAFKMQMRHRRSQYRKGLVLKTLQMALSKGPRESLSLQKVRKGRSQASTKKGSVNKAPKLAKMRQTRQVA